jgi:DNA polymerase III epsilon subunit-like protein
MTVTLLDLETTDFPNQQRSSHPSQPHIVGLCALLCEDDGTILRCHDVLVRPDGWVSSPSAQAAHMIPYERLVAEGIPEPAAVELLLACTARSTRRVAHHIHFDQRIIRIALLRYFGESAADAWAAGPESYCTLQAARRMLGLRANKLGNVYEALFDEPMIGAHDALFDTLALRRIYFELVRREAMAAAPLATAEPALCVPELSADGMVVVRAQALPEVV